MKLSEIFETIAIFVAIFSLWPVILKWNHVGWQLFMYAMLGAMAVVFVRRWRRYTRMLKDQQAELGRRRAR